MTMDGAAPPPWSRANPSPRYRALVELYRDMHVNGERQLGIPADATFDGRSLPRQGPRIKALIDRFGARTLLDYGAGKGRQYAPMPVTAPDGKQYGGIVEWWGVERVTCYDPGYRPFDALPGGTFDGVISTDMLEHCPEEDMPWIVGEMFGFARKFLFANAACYPAKKQLPTGENAHCTIKPPEWWKELFAAAGAKQPDTRWCVLVETISTGPDGKAKIVETAIQG